MASLVLSFRSTLTEGARRATEVSVERHPRKKYQPGHYLAAVKAQWPLFQQISADTKDLNDIPHDWPQALDLPAARIQAHIAPCGVELRHLAWQTDNGGEFIGHPIFVSSLRSF